MEQISANGQIINRGNLLTRTTTDSLQYVRLSLSYEDTMRTIQVRFNSNSAVESISKKMNMDLIKYRSVDMNTGLDLFGNTTIITAKKDNREKKHYEIDVEDFEWTDMPEYRSIKVYPYHHIELKTNFTCDQLSDFFEQPITEKTKSIWYPKKDKHEKGINKYIYTSDDIKPRYPIYIISKGRAEACLTAQTLMWMGVDFYIVVEPNEIGPYQSIYGNRVITGDFDTTTASSIPVRNWIDDHATSQKYWLLDDNIRYFWRMTNNISYRVKSPAIFAAVEDFTDRYTNVGISGMYHLGLCKNDFCIPPYYLNTRVYSMSLMNKEINNQIKINGKLWRGRYNEDTDLCLRILKAGFCTINFATFLGDKVASMRMKGGNTDSVYTDNDDRYLFAKSLQDQHPDCVTVTKKFNRYHHHVDYKRFQQQLKIKDTYRIQDYNFKLELKDET